MTEESKYACCVAWSEKLSVPDENLSPSDRLALEAHLQECPRCSVTRAEYQMLRTLMHSLPVPSLPDELPPQLVTCWREEGQRETTQIASEEVVAGISESDNQYQSQRSDIDLLRTPRPVVPPARIAGSNLQISVQCHDRFFEVLQEELESTELIVEDAISQVLLDLFGELSIDDVAIHFSPGMLGGLQHCSIQIRAQCSYSSFALSPHTKEHIERSVEKRISLILKELFGSVRVDSVTVAPFSTESQKHSSFLASG